MSVGGKVTSSSAATDWRYTASTSSTHIDIHAPLSATWSPSSPKVAMLAPRPRPPCPSRHRKISYLPDRTAPNEGGDPHSKPFSQPHFSNHATLAAKSLTFRIGVMCVTFIGDRSDLSLSAGKNLNVETLHGNVSKAFRAPLFRSY